MKTVHFFKGFLAASALGLALATPASAAPLILSGSTVEPSGSNTVPSGTAVYTVSVGADYTSNAVIAITASGTLNLDATDGPALSVTTNAAGVITASGSSRPAPGNTVGTTLVQTPGSPGGAAGPFFYGELLVQYTHLGVTQFTTAIFPTDASDGLGSSTPTTTVSTTTTLQALGFTSGLVSGDSISFFAADSGYFNNAGGYSITGNINEISSVPEIDPKSAATPVALGISLLLIAADRRRKATV